MEEQRSNPGDWEAMVTKPVETADGKQVGSVYAIQPERIVVYFGAVSPSKYLIPKSSVEEFDGIVHIKEDMDFVESNYRFE